MSEADRLYSRGPYPGQTFTDYSDPTITGLTTLEAFGMNPTLIPGYADALNTYQNTVSGDYLYGGDAFNAALTAAQNEIVPRVKSAFNAAGRTSGGLEQAAIAEELADAFAGLYGDERARQQQAMGALPQMYNAALMPA